MRVLIVGGGRVGRHLARTLAASGQAVTVVDRDEEACARIRALGIIVVCGDGCTSEPLEAAGVRQCDVLAAVLGVDEDNLVTALLARREYAVPRVVARVNDPGNAWLFTPARGVDAAVSQAHLISTIIREELSPGAKVTLSSLDEGETPRGSDRSGVSKGR